MEVNDVANIKLIYAGSIDGFIGKDGKIPWHIPEDFARFKALTTNHIVVMGRKTWESLPVRPLPNRSNVVISQRENYTDFCKAVGKSSDALAYFSQCAQAASPKDIWVIGGESIYKAALPFASEIYETLVDKTVNGDTKSLCPIQIAQHGFVAETDASQWLTSITGTRYLFTKYTKSCAA